MSELAASDPDGKVGILLADDRAEDLRVLIEVLQAPNRDLVTATSGSEALRHLLERDFAVIVLDVMMPAMDGFELASLIRGRKRSAQTPILFLTGVGADTGALRRAYALGAVDYLNKPVSADVLRAKVSVFVALFEKDRRIRHQAQELLDAARRNRELELEQLRMAELRRYRNLADAIPQKLWTADVAGKMTFFNARWSEYVGKEGAPDWAAAVHEEEQQVCRSRWRGAIADGQPFETICRLRGADDTYRWHLCRVAPEHGVDGEKQGWIGTFTDLDDMLRAHRKAERAIRIRDEFLSVASHELRTPLSALLVQLGTLDRAAVDAPEKLRKKVSASLRHTSRLTKLVDNLLDISRLSSQRIPLELEEFDLADLVRDVSERFNETARQAGCELVVRADSMQGRWDRLRIEQVMTNLLSNAVKYGRGRPVEVVLEADGEEARLRVRDGGIGIAIEDQVRIFERFERAAPVKHFGGLGLGLYITRTIVEAHGGAIEVASEPGNGSTFVVSLPFRATSNTPRAMPQVEEAR